MAFPGGVLPYHESYQQVYRECMRIVTKLSATWYRRSKLGLCLIGDRSRDDSLLDLNLQQALDRQCERVAAEDRQVGLVARSEASKPLRLPADDGAASGETPERLDDRDRLLRRNHAPAARAAQHGRLEAEH